MIEEQDIKSVGIKTRKTRVIIKLIAISFVVVLQWTFISDFHGFLKIMKTVDLTGSSRTKAAMEYQPTIVKKKPKEATLADLTKWQHDRELLCNNSTNLSWMTNRVYPLDTFQRIPNIVHQTSQTRCIHDKFFQLTKRWQEMANYSYYFHDDAAVWRLINRDEGWVEFPHLLTVLHCVNSMTAISDVWRYLVLWEYGGIYSDLDSTPNAWTPDFILPDDDALFVVEHYDAPSQYWMAVSPKHPILYHAIHHALLKLLILKEVGNLDAALVTGPFALLDAFTWFMHDVGVSVGKPVVAGFYQGKYNRSVRIIGKGRGESNEFINRDAIGGGKQNIYRENMNMSHFSQMRRRWRTSNRTCLSVIYDVTVGPPPGFEAGRIGLDHRPSTSDP